MTQRAKFATIELHLRRADVAELADAHGSGPCSRKGVEVQVLSSAPMLDITDGQLFVLGLSIVIPSSMLLYSNGRDADVKETLRAEIAVGFERLINRMDENYRELVNRIQRLEGKVGVEYPARR